MFLTYILRVINKMNPLYNPNFLFSLLKSYLIDLNRLSKINNTTLKKFQDSALKKVVKYAYTVPLYHKKYKEAGINPDDIKGIDDLEKLPFIGRDDIRNNFPDGIVPSNFNKKKAFMSCTSGTTDTSVSLYGGKNAAINWVMGSIREIKAHDVNWRKTRLTIITDLSEHSVVRGYIYDGVATYLSPFFSLDNVQLFDVSCDPKETIKKINSFNPEVIHGFPGVLKKFAVLRRRGLGKDIQPRCMLSIGQVLDKYTKKDIENTFQTQIFESYGATEVGPIAFQCKNNMYHIHSDLVFLEVIDDNSKRVSPCKRGKIAITRLFGDGTPFIRYTGIDDIVTLSEKKCNCGINSELIQDVHGRETQSIVLSGGRIVLPSSISSFYGKISEQINMDKIDGFQLIQHSLHDFEIFLLIDKDMRNTPPSPEKIFKTIKKNFEETFGSDNKVCVKEKKEIKQHTPSIISEVDKTRIKNKIYV